MLQDGLNGEALREDALDLVIADLGDSERGGDVGGLVIDGDREHPRVGESLGFADRSSWPACQWTDA